MFLCFLFGEYKNTGIREYKTLDLLIRDSFVGLDGFAVGMERNGGFKFGCLHGLRDSVPVNIADAGGIRRQAHAGEKPE